MILDSSAVVAILKREPDASKFSRKIEAAQNCKISAANFVEAAIVIDAKRVTAASQEFDDFFLEAGVAIVPVDAEHARIARAAYRDFGKGSGHKAQLNFGDCFAYALAKATGEKLLYKGRDFAHTDVASALD